MTIGKIATVSTIIASCLSGVAVAAAPVRASDSHVAGASASVSLGKSARSGQKVDAENNLVGGSLILILIAGAAVVAGVIAATDNGSSN